MRIFFPADLKSRHRKNFCITGSNVTINNWCTLQWSLEVKTCVVLWKVFKGYSFWICIWLTSNLSLFFFHCFHNLFCWQEIQSQQLDRYRYNLWYFGYMFLMSNFHTLSYNILLKELWLKAIIFNSFSIM